MQKKKMSRCICKITHIECQRFNEKRKENRIAIMQNIDINKITRYYCIDTYSNNPSFHAVLNQNV